VVVKFIFKPLTPSDLNLLCEWLAKPHVLEWWNDYLTPEEIKEKYGKHIGNDMVYPYIVYLNNQPIAFIQYYWANKVGDGWWPNEDEHTVGLDQFIGEESYINKGYGTLMLKEFVQLLFQNPLIKKIITEADPNNLRAKRCYEKVGFLELGTIDTPDGESILMAIYKDDESLVGVYHKNLISKFFMNHTY
jgi:RimJ/RimL family protein N-acetyltransferase